MPADALRDNDESLKYFGAGPGRRKRPSPGPVDALYADGAIEVPCADCGAEAHAYCRWPNGSLRKTPCGSRRAPMNTPNNDTRRPRTDA